MDSTSNDARYNTATAIIDRSAVLAPLEHVFRKAAGRRSGLTVRAFLVVAQMNGLRKHHVSHITQIAQVVAYLTADQRTALNIGTWTLASTYDRVDRFFNRLDLILRTGIVVTRTVAQGQGTLLPDDYRQPGCDDGYFWAVPDAHIDCDGNATEPLAVVGAAWFLHCMTRAGINPTLDNTITGSIAVDGTAWKTSAILRGTRPTVTLDGLAEQDTPHEDENTTKPRAYILASGPDGRAIWTADLDARSGYATATNGNGGGPYVGYELHLAANVRAVTHTDCIDQVTLGPTVPPFITNATLAPAGDHRADAIVPSLIGSKNSGQPLTEVLADPGYSLCREDTWSVPLRHARIDVLYKPVTHQRGYSKTNADALKYDDTLLHPATPPAIRSLLDANGNEQVFPYPPYGMNSEARYAFELPFNIRARWRLRHHKTDADGTEWFICPFCKGSLSAPHVTVRNETEPGARATPVGPLVPNLDVCCNGMIAMRPDELGRWQKIPTGTTAHAIAYHGRRQQIENVNSALKATFVRLDKNHALVFGQTKRSILLGFTLAGYNERTGQDWTERAETAAARPLTGTRLTRKTLSKE